MTEEEIEANAWSDPDSAPETEEEIARAWGVEFLQQTRANLKLTQAEFSQKFRIPLGTLRDWERGVSVPDASARTLLRVIAKEPEAVIRALPSQSGYPLPYTLRSPLAPNIVGGALDPRWNRQSQLHHSPIADFEETTAIHLRRAGPVWPAAMPTETIR